MVKYALKLALMLVALIAIILLMKFGLDQRSIEDVEATTNSERPEWFQDVTNMIYDAANKAGITQHYLDEKEKAKHYLMDYTIQEGTDDWEEMRIRLEFLSEGKGSSFIYDMLYPQFKNLLYENKQEI